MPDSAVIAGDRIRRRRKTGAVRAESASSRRRGSAGKGRDRAGEGIRGNRGARGRPRANSVGRNARGMGLRLSRGGGLIRPGRGTAIVRGRLGKARRGAVPRAGAAAERGSARAERTSTNVCTEKVGVLKKVRSPFNSVLWIYRGNEKWTGIVTLIL